MIEIGKSFALGSDTYNVILYKKYTGKKGTSKGKEIWKADSYFSSPQNALNYLVGLAVRETSLKDLKTVCAKIDEVAGLIKELGESPTPLPRITRTHKKGHKESE